jgi:hypothetical protein
MPDSPSTSPGAVPRWQGNGSNAAVGDAVLDSSRTTIEDLFLGQAVASRRT